MQDALGYLSRHQARDGSWGGGLLGCWCPAEVPSKWKASPIPEARRRQISGLISQFESDKIDARDRAQTKLALIGFDAVQQLREASRGRHPETRALSQSVLKRLARVGYGGDLESTGLAILAFVGAGFSHLSRDKLGGSCAGTTVKNGLRWIIGHRKLFSHQHPLPGILASLALIESYGLTRSILLKKHAERATAFVIEVRTKDTRTVLWKCFALESARRFGLVRSTEECFAAAQRLLQQRRGALPCAGRILLRVWRKQKPDPSELKEITSNPPPFESHILLMVASALIQARGPRSQEWRKWGWSVRKALAPKHNWRKDHCARGSWDGARLRDRTRSCVLKALTLQVYYRYANSFSKPR